MNLHETAAYESHNEPATPTNQNISSVLSKIQDDGPAYSDSSEQNNLVDFRTNITTDKTSASVKEEKSIQDEVHLDLAAVLKQKQQAIPEASKLHFTKKAKITINNTAWIQLSLTAITTLVIVTYMYSLDVRTNQLEQSLNLHEDSVLESIEYQGKLLSPGINSLKKTLLSVKKELELIKTDVVSDRKDKTQAGNNPAQFVTSVQVNENVNMLKDEVVALRNELQTVSNKLKAINKTNNRASEYLVEKSASVNSAVSTNEWVVNIASFTDRNKTKKAAARLSLSDYLPSIEEATVNGARVYRLTVGGFKDRKQAQRFVRKAASEYGMKNGWIKKS